MNQEIPELLQRLWQHINIQRKKQLAFLLCLMLLVSLVEVFSIGAVLPFIAALTNPKSVYEYPGLQTLIELLGVTQPSQILLPLTFIFGSAVLIAAVMRLLLLWATTRLSFATGADLGFSIYRRTLYQPYLVHCSRNSSEIIAGISSKANSVILAVIFPLLNLLSSTVILIVILSAIVSVEPIIALFIFGGFGVIYLLVIRFTKKQSLIDSHCIANESVNVIKCLQEGLGGIRDVLIDGSQEAYCRIYMRADARLRRAQGNHVFISGGPRYFVEALGMLLISIIAYVIAQGADGINDAVPILGFLALGAQRLLPALQQVYASWSSIHGGRASLQDTLDLLDQPLPLHLNQMACERIPFNNVISLKNLSFRYKFEKSYVLNNINLEILKGSRVGFIGPTGSGKTTLLDVIMGLLPPTDGSLEIDGKTINSSNRHAWQAHIAHVPQDIYLSDASIEQNIAFGVSADNIDNYRVREVAKIAQISETIEGWPERYQTKVGERGVCLSGGQRQRIGIARALYKEAKVIILDEATSALDSQTEQAVMDAIEKLDKNLTLLIIAHRLTTLKNCTHIVELRDSYIAKVGGYYDVIAQ